MVKRYRVSLQGDESVLKLSVVMIGNLINLLKTTRLCTLYG